MDPASVVAGFDDDSLSDFLPRQAGSFVHVDRLASVSGLNKRPRGGGIERRPFAFPTPSDGFESH